MTAPPRRSERVLCALLLAAVCCWMIRAHWEDVDLPWQSAKVALHQAALAGTAPDPYQYKLWAVSHALQWAHEITGQRLPDVFFANTLLGLLLLVWAHHRWLRTYVGVHLALLGGVLLGALANILFLTYAHHPYEFWGVALYCLLLHAVERDVGWVRLAVLCLVTGLVWEKHALVPVLWGLLQLRRRRAFLPALGKGLLIFAAALAVPLLVRWHLGMDRPDIDGMTHLHLQAWDKVLWFQLPFVLPFAAIFLLRADRLPTWVRLLWLYVPLLFVAYASQSFVLHEVRSFWALVPVFTATFVLWFAGTFAEPAQSPGPQSCQAAQ